MRTLFLAIYLLGSYPLYANPIAEGHTVPDWTLNTPSGQAINYYEDTRDQVSVLLFWATWCPYCRALMPHLQQIADDYRDKPVKFYALNIWEDGDPVRYIKENGFNFILLLQADDITKSYNVKGTPGLFVIDTNHYIRYIRRSGQEDLDVKRAVEKAIESASPVK